ncbi:MAG: DUF4236 domain-containing protein [Peptostreptococcaceae bacterium]|nr:DUF4236 domain-containing protein [Peptostreptococcaceae bacterium]
MGFNFRKSKNIGKGFRINMTQNGPGLSFGKIHRHKAVEMVKYNI